MWRGLSAFLRCRADLVPVFSFGENDVRIRFGEGDMCRY